MRKVALSIMIFSTLSVSTVHAEDEKFYAGFNYTDVDISSSRYSNIRNQNDDGFRLDFGYNFNQYFAIEANYYDLGNQSGRFNAPDPINSIAFGYDADAYGLSLVANYDFNNLFIYGKIGVLASDVDGVVTAVQNQVINESGTDLLYGAGIGYAFSDKFSVIIDYSGSEIGGSFEDVDLLSMGLRFSF